jgi:hypothetical protein
MVQYIPGPVILDFWAKKKYRLYRDCVSKKENHDEIASNVKNHTRDLAKQDYFLGKI